MAHVDRVQREPCDGAMLFSLVYGYLALVHGELIFQSVFIQAVGFAMLAGLVVLAKLYWFITPLTGSSVSLFLYSLNIILAWAL